MPLTSNRFYFLIYTAIKCFVDPPLKGTHFSDQRNVFTPGETLNVICDDNYWIDSPDSTEVVTTCNHLGSWTIRPLCTGKKKQLNLQEIVLSVYGLLTHHDDNLALKTYSLFF